MRRPRLPEGMRDQRPDALDLLGRIALTVRRRTRRLERAEEDLLERDAMFVAARKMVPPVKWADLGRAAGCNDVTVMDAVKRVERQEKAAADG